MRKWILQGLTLLLLLMGAAVLNPTALPVSAQEPPPANRCADENFMSGSPIRTQIPDEFKDYLNCRIIMSGGAYTVWNQRALYTSGSIGDPGLNGLGLIAAVDVFSPQGLRTFHDVVICLRGTGELFLLNDTFTTDPREPVSTTAWTSDAFPGYTCGTLYQPGTLVMVRRQPTATERQLTAAREAADRAQELGTCMLTFTYSVRMRQLPTEISGTVTRIAYNKTVRANARAGSWFRINWYGQIGWVSGEYVTSTGYCGSPDA